MSWVDIKNSNNQKMRVPYQAFKDVFEKDGFMLVVDKNSCVDPTFSNFTEQKADDVQEVISTKEQTSTKTAKAETKNKGGTNNGGQHTNKVANRGKRAKQV